MIGKLFAPLAMKIAGGIIAALLAFVAVLLIQIHGVPIIGGGLKAELASERTAHLETQKRYAQAQVEAADKARAYRLSEEARYRVKAERTDTEHAKELDGALAAAGRYADRNRCVRTQAATGASSGPGTIATGDSAPRADGPGAAAELVGVSEDDLAICTTNTARLIAAREWALGLNAE